MKRTVLPYALSPVAFLAALPAQAQSFNLFVPVFERLPLVTDFFGFLFLIVRNWLVFALQALPIVF
jgi:hypothetical protein